VLWAPDLYILDLGQPVRAVAVLILMHLAIALVTYNSLVHIARVKPLPDDPAGPPAQDSGRRAGASA